MVLAGRQHDKQGAHSLKEGGGRSQEAGHQEEECLALTPGGENTILPLLPPPAPRPPLLCFLKGRVEVCPEQVQGKQELLVSLTVVLFCLGKGHPKHMEDGGMDAKQNKENGAALLRTTKQGRSQKRCRHRLCLQWALHPASLTRPCGWTFGAAEVKKRAEPTLVNQV